MNKILPFSNRPNTNVVDSKEHVRLLGAGLNRLNECLSYFEHRKDNSEFALVLVHLKDAKNIMEYDLTRLLAK